MKALRARIARLDELCTGLILERQRWNYGDSPFRSRERRDYDEALSKAINALGDVRKVLARVADRLENQDSTMGRARHQEPADG
jgi:hypothetical protein